MHFVLVRKVRKEPLSLGSWLSENSRTTRGPRKPDEPAKRKGMKGKEDVTRGPD